MPSHASEDPEEVLAYRDNNYKLNFVNNIDKIDLLKSRIYSILGYKLE